MRKPTDTLIMPHAAVPRQTLGNYEILREIGRGGMSLVYEARDLGTERHVALKVLHIPVGLTPQQAQAMLSRFEREARAVALLSHPNIVGIHEIGEDKGQHFLALEFLPGETLRRWLERGSLTPAQSVGTIRQIAAALDAVHAVGVVHRDIKPSNIMLLPDGTAKLLDFGVARQNDDSTVTSTGALVGSPAYMSPEQVRGEPGVAASDIWALGALLYEMLAGHPPFMGKTIPAVLYQVTHEAPAPIIGIPAPVQKVVRHALEKHPSRRYPTARALADALTQAASPDLEAARSGPAPRLMLFTVLAVLFVVGIALSIRRLTPAPSIPAAGLVPTAPHRGSVATEAVPAAARRAVLALPRKRHHRLSSVRASVAIGRKPTHTHHFAVQHAEQRATRRFHAHRHFRRLRLLHGESDTRHDQDDNPQAAQNLEKFIYSPDSPGL